MKKLTVALAVTASALLLSSPAMAFHSGGVAECEGCHTMHNSLDGAQMDTDKALGVSGPYLLMGNDASSACLNCHGEESPGSYHIASIHDPTSINNQTAPWQFSPGGDFGWLKRDWTWVPRTGAAVEEQHGMTRGHSVIAADFNFVQDTTKAGNVAPRGAYVAGAGYPVASLACSSCHDPHGRYRRTSDDMDAAYTTTGAPIYSSGSYGATSGVTPAGTTLAVGAYRILGGINYLPKSMNGTASLAFSYDPPAAISPSTYNVSESAAKGQLRVAYGKGMSEWCANCHKGMHAAGAFASGTGTVHPAGNGAVLTGGWPNSVATNYNAYIKSGDMGGSVATAYNTLVPFETGEGDAGVLTERAALLKWDGTVTGNDARGRALVAAKVAVGAEAGAQVMCLSCHKAHASAFPSMLRYQVENEFTLLADSTGAVAYPGTDLVGNKASSSMGQTQAIWQAAYNMRDADKVGAPYQRALCNKCHAKD